MEVYQATLPEPDSMSSKDRDVGGKVSRLHAVVRLGGQATTAMLSVVMASIGWLRWFGDWLSDSLWLMHGTLNRIDHMSVILRLKVSR